MSEDPRRMKTATAWLNAGVFAVLTAVLSIWVSLSGLLTFGVVLFLFGFAVDQSDRVWNAIEKSKFHEH